MVSDALNPDLSTENVRVIKDGDDTWIAAEIVHSDGAREPQPDVWLIHGGQLYAVTGGADTHSGATRHADVHYGLNNEFASHVAACVTGGE